MRHLQAVSAKVRADIDAKADMAQQAELEGEIDPVTGQPLSLQSGANVMGSSAITSSLHEGFASKSSCARLRRRLLLGEVSLVEELRKQDEQREEEYQARKREEQKQKELQSKTYEGKAVVDGVLQEASFKIDSKTGFKISSWMENATDTIESQASSLIGKKWRER